MRYGSFVHVFFSTVVAAALGCSGEVRSPSNSVRDAGDSGEPEIEAGVDGTGGSDALHGGTWKLVQTFRAPTPESDAQYGYVGITASYVFVGAPGASAGKGAAYAYALGANGLTADGVLTASDGTPGDGFGFRVAGSGDTVLVGAFSADLSKVGAAYAFRRATAGWSFEAKLISNDGRPGDLFGVVGIDGDNALIGAYAVPGPKQGITGAAYAFHRSGTAWAQTQKLVPDGLSRAGPSEFGVSVSIRGDQALIGALGGYVYSRGDAGWAETTLVSVDPALNSLQGESATAFDGTTIAIGDLTAFPGSVYTFDHLSMGWTLHQTLPAPVARRGVTFGDGVAVDRDWLAVTSGVDGVYAGNVDMFHRVGGQWVYAQEVVSPSAGALERFGRSIALSGNLLVIGAPYADSGASHAGAAYVYRYE